MTTTEAAEAAGAQRLSSQESPTHLCLHEQPSSIPVREVRLDGSCLADAHSPVSNILAINVTFPSLGDSPHRQARRSSTPYQDSHS